MEIRRTISKERLEEMIKHEDCDPEYNCSLNEEVLPSEIISMARELLERRKADRWIPVSERLPDAVDDYLVEIQSARGLAKWRDVKTFADGKFHGMRCGDNVVRWRPLPAPPEVSNG